MNVYGILFAMAMAWLMFALPRRWAPLPLLMGASYIFLGQEMEIGPLHFPVVRIIIGVGFLRILTKGERLQGKFNTLDRWMVGWAAWAVLTIVFHTSEALLARLGMVYNTLGSYFLFRVLLQDMDDIRGVFKMICILLVPVAVVMLLEKFTGQNAFAMIGFGSPDVALRHGHFRARGPFAHAILAGTVGAVCFPMALMLWARERKIALVGLFATGGIVFASGASGPIMTVLTILLALGLWVVRGQLHLVRWATVLLIFVLSFVMKDPVYYLVARIDLTGGSTGWHRAALIDGAMKYFSTWWLTGTDYTRNWMPTGVTWNSAHTDITNHYLQMGVWGGLLLMGLFMGTLWAAFAAVGETVRSNSEADFEERFLVWTLGAILFGHATTFFSVSYFDQTVIFLYLVLAAIGSLQGTKLATTEPVAREEDVCAEAVAST